MEDIDLKVISSHLSQKLKFKVNIIGIEYVSSGYHSDGYKLTASDGKKYFLKRVKSYDLGFEIPERRVNSLLISQGMAERADVGPKPLGVVIQDENNSLVIQGVKDDTEIYHLQEYEENTHNYWQLLEKRIDKTNVDSDDKEEIAKVVELIAKVHAVKFPSSDEHRLKLVYNDSLRSKIGNPELLLTMMKDLADDDPLMPYEKQKEHLVAMFDLIHRFRDRSDRLRALHGDFWGANLFFRPDGTAFLIDFSRIPWGDPGVDTGWWLSQYLWFYHMTGNPYFKELGEEFLSQYIKKTGDSEIRKASSLPIGLHGVIYVTIGVYKHVDISIKEKFLAATMKSVEKGEFVWE